MMSKLQNPWRNFGGRTSRVVRSVLHSGDIPVILTWHRTRDPDRGSLVLWPREGHRAVRARSGIARDPVALRGPSARSLLDEWMQKPGPQPSPAVCRTGLGEAEPIGIAFLTPDTPNNYIPFGAPMPCTAVSSH